MESFEGYEAEKGLGLVPDLERLFKLQDGDGYPKGMASKGEIFQVECGAS